MKSCEKSVNSSIKCAPRRFEHSSASSSSNAPIAAVSASSSAVANSRVKQQQLHGTAAASVTQYSTPQHHHHAHSQSHSQNYHHSHHSQHNPPQQQQHLSSGKAYSSSSSFSLQYTSNTNTNNSNTTSKSKMNVTGMTSQSLNDTTKNHQQMTSSSSSGISSGGSANVTGRLPPPLQSSIQSQPVISVGLQTNAICKLFQPLARVGCYGHDGIVWKIYDAVRIRDNLKCSMIIFDKRSVKLKNKNDVVDFLRLEVQNLTMFNHEKLLKVIHPVEENTETLAFITERLIGSLQNMIHGDEHTQPDLQSINAKNSGFNEMSSTLSSSIASPSSKQHQNFLTDFDIKHGIYQINLCLRYLHSSQQIIHGNVHLGSILIGANRSWYLAGTQFMQKFASAKNEITPYTGDLFNGMISNNTSMPYRLDYTAPEIHMTGRHSPAVDMFALGLVIYATYNNGKIPITSGGGNIKIYLESIKNLHSNFKQTSFNLPNFFLEPVEKMINHEVKMRPNSQLFSLLKCFNDPIMLMIDNVICLWSKTQEERNHIYETLMENLPKLSKSLIYTRVFPVLVYQEAVNITSLAEYEIFVQVFSAVLNQSTNIEFKSNIEHSFLKILHRCRSTDFSEIAIWLSHSRSIICKLTPEQVYNEVIPHIVDILDSDASPKIHLKALRSIPIICEKFSAKFIKKIILPKTKGLFYATIDKQVHLEILVCLNALIPMMNRNDIASDVVPFLVKINVQDAETLMQILDFYTHMIVKQAYTNTDIFALEILPTLIPYTVTVDLSNNEYKSLMHLIHMLLQRIDKTNTAATAVGGVSVGGERTEEHQQHHYPHATGASTSTNAPKFMTSDDLGDGGTSRRVNTNAAHSSLTAGQGGGGNIETRCSGGGGGDSPAKFQTYNLENLPQISMSISSECVALSGENVKIDQFDEIEDAGHPPQQSRGAAIGGTATNERPRNPNHQHRQSTQQQPQQQSQQYPENQHSHKTTPYPSDTKINVKEKPSKNSHLGKPNFYEANAVYKTNSNPSFNFKHQPQHQQGVSTSGPNQMMMMNQQSSAKSSGRNSLTGETPPQFKIGSVNNTPNSSSSFLNKTSLCQQPDSLLLVPPGSNASGTNSPVNRRHSSGSSTSLGTMLTGNICEGPFIHPSPMSSAVGGGSSVGGGVSGGLGNSRRPSHVSSSFTPLPDTNAPPLNQPTLFNDSLKVTNVVRRSSFNALSDSVMNFFSAQTSK